MTVFCTDWLLVRLMRLAKKTYPANHGNDSGNAGGNEDADQIDSDLLIDRLRQARHTIDNAKVSHLISPFLWN